MDNMQELYEKVAKNSGLLAKFSKIMVDADIVGEHATGEKLAAFAKEAGYDIKPEEMRDFFKRMSERKEGELSDAELDMVAGGKSAAGIFNIIVSAASLGVDCGASSL